MFILYSVAPLLYRMSSSAYYNISLLTSDFYGLLFGLFLFVRVATYFFQKKMANQLRWNSTTHPSGFTSRRLLWYLWVWSYTSGMPHVSILFIRVRWCNTDCIAHCSWRAREAGSEETFVRTKRTGWARSRERHPYSRQSCWCWNCVEQLRNMGSLMIKR